ncbi:hypothetical protein DB32_000283 [Sandaracinus amylolyticus]|uniref:Uncharacterized protein n=1 Tax=Sandaracinus amylolyticus TaxID=927083 RepID=A0A0F6SDB1_9BACT|nr:hypothetical protein DB32_000283 [Sandaracinus amylolyticus]
MLASIALASITTLASIGSRGGAPASGSPPIDPTHPETTQAIATASELRVLMRARCRRASRSGHAARVSRGS